jgi:hypothetical protein
MLEWKKKSKEQIKLKLKKNSNKKLWWKIIFYIRCKKIWKNNKKRKTRYNYKLKFGKKMQKISLIMKKYKKMKEIKW